MKTAVILCTLFSLGLCDSLVRQCRQDWELGNGEKSCYKVVKLQTSWAQAYMWCTVLRSHLADITSQFEQDSVADILKTKYSDYYEQFWIDLSDMSTEGDWRLMTFNQNTTFTPWIQGQPNNYDQAENCAHINAKPERNFMWNDHNCQAQLNFICEAYPEEVYVD
ncbi:perlucin-like [Haliotis rufescens]|uniref:perlucin-like n=1 Tax=Haliotis rufescens TaxID=6454 RepID=UPI001EAFE53D|nr:perlucin-like [Haliotis rufescens]